MIKVGDKVYVAPEGEMMAPLQLELYAAPNYELPIAGILNANNYAIALERVKLHDRCVYWKIKPRFADFEGWASQSRLKKMGWCDQQDEIKISKTVIAPEVGSTYVFRKKQFDYDLRLRAEPDTIETLLKSPIPLLFDERFQPILATGNEITIVKSIVVPYAFNLHDAEILRL